MSVITIQTSQGLKQVRIEGEEPTPEEIERAREIFEYPQGAQGVPMPRETPAGLDHYSEAEGKSTLPMDFQGYSETPESTNVINPAAQARALVKGPTRAAGHALKTAFALVPESTIVDAVGQISPYATKEDVTSASLGVSTEDSPLGTQATATRIEQELRDIPREQGLAGITETMSQFLTPYVGLRSAGLQSVPSAFVTGATSFDTQQGRLSNVIAEEFPDLAPVVTSYLKYEPGSETMLEGALKNGIEMGALDAGLALTFQGALKLHRAYGNARKTGRNPDEVLENIRKDPDYEDLLKLQDDARFDDVSNVRVPPPPLPKPGVIKPKEATKGGAKLMVNSTKEKTAHASQGTASNEQSLYDSMRATELRAIKTESILKGEQPKGSFIQERHSGIPITKEGVRGAIDGLDVLIRPVKSRIIAVDPVLGPRVATMLDRYSMVQRLHATEQGAKLQPALKVYQKLSAKDKKAFDSAYKYNDAQKMNDIFNKSGIRVEGPLGQKITALEALRQARQGFDDMHQLARAHGTQLGYRDHYLPLHVKDFKAFREHIGRTSDPGRIEIENAMKAYAEKELPMVAQNNPSLMVGSGASKQPIPASNLNIDYATGRITYGGKRFKDLEMPAQEQRKLVDSILLRSERGTMPSSTREPGLVQERKVIMRADLEPFYANFSETVSQYPQTMAKLVSRQLLDGKVPGIPGYKQEMRAIMEQMGIKELDKASQISRLVGQVIKGEDASLGNFTRGYRDFVYSSTIGNPLSAITQMSEVGLNAHRYNLINSLIGTTKATVDNMPQFIKNALNKPDMGLRMKALGLDDIGAEFRGAGGRGPVSKSMNVLLNGGTIKGVKIPGAMTLSGFRKIDFIMKEANMNAALKKAKAQLRTAKGEDAFRKEMFPFYRQETNQLINALKNAKPENLNNMARSVDDDLVRLHLWSELSKTQPISMAEMPEAYLKSNFLRSAYWLKSFGLKQLETARRDIFRKLASDNKKEKAEGFYNMLSLGALFGGGTTGASMAKDWILDRDTEANDYLWDAAAQSYAGQSRYQMQKAWRQNEPIDKVLELVKPATPGLKETSRLLSGDDDFEEFLRQILKLGPVGGKFIYHRFGAGKDLKYELNRRKGGRLPSGFKPPTGPRGPSDPDRRYR
tara:strand:+ start:1238 stop:4657 length:3420 start_codon:yes stop_codon:yes gene_type:complete